MKKINKLLNACAPPLIWAGVIFLFSSQASLPGFEESIHDFIFKKTAHIFVYLVLYLLLKRAVEITINKKSSRKQLLVPVFICLVYAVSDELHQSFVPGRYATLRDVGYDMFGVGVAFLRKYDFI